MLLQKLYLAFHIKFIILHIFSVYLQSLIQISDNFQMVLLCIVKNATVRSFHIIFIMSYLRYINLIEISHYFKIKEFSSD